MERSAAPTHADVSLAQRTPRVTAADLLAGLRPPPQFAGASFDSYRPDPNHTSQQSAQERMRALAAGVVQPKKRGLFGKKAATARSLYLDGGYGVGKTHLLTSLAHAVGPERSAYGTFVEYTHLVGALGFAACVKELSTRALVCIDEFELDDPGDTLIMSRLLRELDDAGVVMVATSNTLPEALGEGRFAADMFQREIQALAARFDILRIDGPDYRHRDGTGSAPGLTPEEIAVEIGQVSGASLDDFDELLAHLAKVHPSRYGVLVDGVPFAGITGSHPIDDDMVGLRLVVLVDRLYDRDVPVRIGPLAAQEIFSERMLTKGYRKKYLRALSRLGALTRRAAPV